jgi:group I intron endonuclease
MVIKGIIYKITNKVNGKVYIGQTIQSFKRRIKSHKSHLQSQKHHNELLQKAYNKYGWSAFEAEIIETCDVDKIDARERFWISEYKATDHSLGYNFESGGNVLKKHNPSTIKKFILSSRGENNKIKACHIEAIKRRIIAGDSLTDVANDFGVSKSCIYRIKNLQNWEYIAPELNEMLINTDTSRKIKHLTDEQKDECRSRIAQGEPPFTLSQEYGIPYKRFSEYFQNEIDDVCANLKASKETAIKMFFDNKPVKDILDKTGLSYPQYKKVTAGMIEERRKRNILYVGKQKAKGKTNSELAKELNVNRCTITVYIKEYNQKYANTVINH